MSADLADRFVECVDDSVRFGFERVLPVSAAAPTFVALGHVGDTEHREVTEMIAHSARDEWLVPDGLTDRRVPGAKVSRSNRGGVFQIQRHQRVENVATVGTQPGDTFRDAGAFEQLLSASDVRLGDAGGVLLAGEVAAFHQEFDRLTGVAGVAGTDRGAVPDHGVVDDPAAEGDLDAALEDRPELVRVVGREVQFRLAQRGLDLRGEPTAELEVIRDADQPEFGRREVAVVACPGELIQDAVVLDRVDLVEDDEHRAAEGVEVGPELLVDGREWVARRADLARRVAEAVDQPGRDLIGGRDAVAVQHDDVQLEVGVSLGIVLEVIEEIPRRDGLADAGLAVEEDVVGLLAVDYGLEGRLVGVEFLRPADDRVGLVILPQGVPVVVDRRVGFEQSHTSPVSPLV